MEVFLQALVNGILLGGFYSLMGMGQNIIFGVMNIVNFCHGEMLMVGMYITYVLYTYFGVDPYVALPIVAVLMFGLGSIPGAFFAGIFLGLLEQMSALFISPSYSDMIVFVTFIVILVVRQVMILRRR
jgi:branched-chain amino acid transport system permease protein